MAQVALHRSVRACQCEFRRRVVIEGSALPVDGGMAEQAVLRESGSHVVRIRGPLKVLQVAALAIGGDGCEIVIDVAQVAGRRNVRAGEWERGLRVIEVGGLPGRGSVAGFAALRESRGHVIGIGGLVEVRQMAA